MTSDLHCPLCLGATVSSFGEKGLFFRCSICDLTFKSPTTYLAADKEKSRYETHENSIDNKGYVNFLNPVAEEVARRLPLSSKGLDYGCGPQPVLALMLNQKGYETGYYDPFFFPEGLKTTKTFDFITCTEAAEHFFKPSQEFERMFSILKPKGTLVLMTEFLNEKTEIETWYYAKDPTHVCFFSEVSLRWIAERFDRNIEIISHRIAVYN